MSCRTAGQSSSLGLSPALLAVALAGCGGSAVEAAATPIDDPAIAPRPSAEAVIAPRRAEVPDAPPDERLVYTSGGSVWLLAPATGEAEAITVRAAEAADTEPALSPDGDALVYASARDGTSALHVISLADLIPERITDGADGGDRDPAWSPDGARIAFVRGDPQFRGALFVVDAAGGEPREIVAADDDHPSHFGAPTWSPDGRHIAFSADRRQGQGTGIFEVEVATGALRRVTPAVAGAPWTRDLEPSYAPDGQRIAFASNRHVASADDAGDTDLYVVSRDGSGLTRLTDDPGIARHPSHSPDGARLYFASTRIRTLDFEWEIFVMAAGGGQQHRVTRDDQPRNRAPSAGRVR